MTIVNALADHKAVTGPVFAHVGRPRHFWCTIVEAQIYRVPVESEGSHGRLLVTVEWPAVRVWNERHQVK
jgi:hypothetical protein